MGGPSYGQGSSLNVVVERPQWPRMAHCAISILFALLVEVTFVPPLHVPSRGYA